MDYNQRVNHHKDMAAEAQVLLWRVGRDHPQAQTLQHLIDGHTKMAENWSRLAERTSRDPEETVRGQH